MSLTIIEAITYPHYATFPVALKQPMNLLRANIYSDEVHGNCQIENIVDHNDMEFLNLDRLVAWIDTTLPEHDTTFLKAAARLHKECFEDEVFDTFLVEDIDLYIEVMEVKDAYELLLAEEK